MITENYELIEAELAHPFSTDNFVERLLGIENSTMYNDTDYFCKYPGLSLEQLLAVKERFFEEFGFYPPKDYLAFLHYCNGFAFCEKNLAGAGVEPDFMDLWELNGGRFWIPSDAGENAILLGRCDDIRYLYLPDIEKYAACEYIIEETYDDFWELLKGCIRGY